MTQSRWVRDVSQQGGRSGGSDFLPSLPSLEVSYMTEPDALAAVLPPPLEPPDDPRVHARITEIDLEFGEFKHHEMVGYFAVDAKHEGERGEYPLLIPIDLESALSISRERFGEPKKLAEIELVRDADHVEGRITRNGVSFIEIVGDVTESLPVSEPYEARQFWFKFLPAAEGEGFDAGPFLVQVEQVRTPESLERVDGKLVLRELATDPVVDLPIVETEAITWTVRKSTHQPKLVGPVDAEAFLPYAYSRYDMVR